jgi:outer membrane protein assembly factor BamA
MIQYAEWDEVDSYQNGNPAFSSERAGSNGSDEDNYIEAKGDDLFAFLNFKYLLPLGDGRDTPPHTFGLRSGILQPGYEAGGRAWNPLESGRTLIEVRPFYRNQDFEDSDTGEEAANETAGLKLTLEYDNTDWYNNPTRGTVQRLTYAQDWGWLDESVEWTALSFRHSQFWNLGETENAQQRVLAFDFWTSHSPSWNDSSTEDGEEVFHRPPLFEGSSLGGLERQRGYPSNRYHDRSAVNYVMEYRHMPKWNPFPDIPLVNKLYIPWWQWVGFVEVGRVNDQYDLGDLHSNMKTTIGGGVRAMVYELVIRVDVGVTEEGGEVQMFFNHPF